jgi:DNA-binding CsgD family transcriptional regulator
LELDEYGSDLERAFDTQILRLAPELPRPRHQFEFASDEGRNFRFDRAFVDYRIGVELEGIYAKQQVICHKCGARVRYKKKDGSLGKVIQLPGYHQRFGRFKSDVEKYNLAVKLNWIVLRFLYDDVYSDPFSMVETIRKVIYNRRFMMPQIEKLSEREDEILHLIAAGFTGPQMADRLGISDSTVNGHIANIREKTCASTQAGAIARALAWGLLDLERVPWPENMAEIFNFQVGDGEGS